MGSKRALYKVPLPSTEFDVDTSLCGNILQFQYYRGEAPYRGGIRFNSMAASRTRAERCCTAWHIEKAYDTLVEIKNSPWVEEIRADTQERWRYTWEMHHYMIYLDSVGCIEVIAESWTILEEEPGLWPNI